MRDRWTDRLSEYLDGELPVEERLAVEAHLENCPDCSALLADLGRVVEQARLVDNRVPTRDLWPGIAERIGATPMAQPDVVKLSSRRRRARRLSVSVPQLAAAGIALMTLSGGAVWVLTSSSSSPPVAAVPVASMPGVTAVSTRSASQSYAAAVADLERVLAGGRGQLDTTTVRVIEENLAAIDRAIAQAQRALNADPANLYLNTHLADTMRRKLELLRQAAALVPVT